MNKSDAERIAGMLDFLGYMQTESPKKADLLIINTCSIRKLAEDKAYSAIGLWGKWKKTRPDIKIVFCGCVAQQQKDNLFKRAPYVDLVLGTHRIYEFPDLLKRINNGEKICSCDEKVFDEKNTPIKRVKGFNAWVPIMEGCNNFCTYCIVPYTRGRERSRDADLIIKEVLSALQDGFKEITLLGQNVDSYYSKGINLSGLLRKLNDIDKQFRIRFVTSYPTDISDELIETVTQLDKVCEYFHIPMQSGDDYILKKMNRRYDTATYKSICDKLRKKVKDVTITSDFIAGFPGETEEQFQHTIDAMKSLELDYANTAAYSPRPITVAGKWTDLFVAEDVKADRLNRLNQCVRECSLASNKKFLGRESEILVESFEIAKKTIDSEKIITGRTRNNKIVHVPCNKDLTGQFVSVKITGAKTWYLTGELI